MSTSPTRERAPALPPDERRDAIIAAATPLLRAGGRRVTTREIADAAGIAEGTIFRVFDSKDALIHAVIEHTMDVTDTVAAVRAVPLDDPLEIRVHRCVGILADRLRAVFDIMMALHPHGPGGTPGGEPGRRPGPGTAPGDRATDQTTHGTTLHDDAARPGMRHSRRGYDDPRQAMLLTAVADLLRPDAARLSATPERAAHMLRLLAFGGSHRMITDNDPLTTDEITDLFLHGITRGGSPADGAGPDAGSDVIPGLATAAPTAPPSSEPEPESETGSAPC